MVGNDEALRWITAMARGDEQGLIALYRTFSAPVHAFIVRRTGSVNDAEELVPEVFYEAFKTAVRFESRASVLTWLLSIAKHRSTDRLRRRIDAEHVDIDDVLGDLSDESPEMIDRLAKRQTQAQFERCLQELPIEQRDCIQLALYHDLGYDAIARIVGCPQNTVKTRVFYAKRRLKDCLRTLLGQLP